MIFAVLTMVATGVANAQPPKCSNTITACGCTIGAPGNYEVANELYASQGLTVKNGCIDIEGQDINLYAAENLIGPGSSSDCNSAKPHLNFGVGIHVLPGAANVSVYLNGNDYDVCGWNYGIESEGRNVNFYYPGAYVNNVGILLNNATNNDCLDCYTACNVTGLEISGGSGNQINGGESYCNSQYGYWIAGSKENILDGNEPTYNKIAGIYLGCSATGDVTPAIPCSTPTTGNSLLGNFAEYNGKYGIAVEQKSIENQIQENGAYYDSKDDFIDGNGNCIYNQYLYNGYNTKSPKCIQ